MLTVHQLGHSQPERVVWLCEELAVPYDLELYARGPVTTLSPPTLGALHPLGAAPVIEDDGLPLAESAAIVEYIIVKHGGGRLRLDPNHPDTRTTDRREAVLGQVPRRPPRPRLPPGDVENGRHARLPHLVPAFRFRPAARSQRRLAGTTGRTPAFLSRPAPCQIVGDAGPLAALRSVLPPQTVFAGLLAAFVGFASTFAVVLRGLTAAGANPAEAASGLMALCVAQGLCALWLSARTRMPISMAWSTPGAALLAASGAVQGGFPVAVGAFVMAAGLVVVAGWWRSLGRAVAAIPATLANAMLAGVLLNLCLAPVRGVVQSPGPALAIVATWAVVGRIHRLLAVPAAVTVTIILIALQPGVPPVTSALPHPVLVWPVFTFAALIGVAVPLFIVTMASQNIPGIAVLSVNGFQPEPGPLFRTTGLFSVLAAPLGGHAVNLAAITAAICAGPDAHPDPAQRWKAAAVSGAAYVMLGPLAAAITGFVGTAPLLIETVAGLALLGAMGSALHGAVAMPEAREAALVTFLVTASGLGFGGISGAFWGLLTGGALLLAIQLRARLSR